MGRSSANGGTRTEEIIVGGENCLPFHHFEGDVPHRPVIAFEIPDVEPPENDWTTTVRAVFQDVLNDPVAWAKKVVDDHGAKLICLHFIGANPDRQDRSISECVDVARAVLEAVKVPLIIQGYGSGDKNSELLAKCAEECRGEGLTLASAVDEYYKTLAAATIAYD
ncbi:MAG: acetyl-CoA decarbonylase/synthase complex subunit delta, partial [bacterium]